MTEATFNKEEFVKGYVEAIRADDADKLVDLIAGLDDEHKQEALAGVIEAIEADEDLAKTAAETLGVLKKIKEVNDTFESAKPESTPEEDKTEGKVEEKAEA